MYYIHEQNIAHKNYIYDDDRTIDDIYLNRQVTVRTDYRLSFILKADIKPKFKNSMKERKTGRERMGRKDSNLKKKISHMASPASTFQQSQ